MELVFISLISFNRATVVKEKTIYWVAVPSETITVGSGIPPSTTVSHKSF